MPETTDDTSQTARPVPAAAPPPRLWRQRLLQLTAHAPDLRPTSALSRLGPDRWHGTAAYAGVTTWELYLSEPDGTILLARRDRERLSVKVYGTLTETSALNLGDCLVRGLECGARRFNLDFGQTGLGDPDALAVVDSLARHLAQQDDAWSIRMHSVGTDGTTYEAAHREGTGAASSRTRRTTSCSRA